MVYLKHFFLKMFTKFIMIQVLLCSYGLCKTFFINMFTKFTETHKLFSTVRNRNIYYYADTIMLHSSSKEKKLI